MTEPNNRKGTWLMISATLIFAMQDGISRHLGGSYSVFSIVMVRYWIFVLFGLWLASRAPGGVKRALHTPYLGLQIARGVLLAAEILVMMVAFVNLGLIATHAIFTSAPLMIAALSGPILGEKVGWRRWTAIVVGLSGVLIILNPGVAVFSPWALVPLLGAFLLALYALLTRYVGRQDGSSVSFFWTGIIGAIIMTAPGLWFWQPMSSGDSLWLATLCCTGIAGHWMLIRCYEIAEASAVQPLVYLQLVFVAILGITVFDEVLRWNVVVGAAIAVAAGLFTLWRQQVRARAEAAARATALSVQP